MHRKVPVEGRLVMPEGVSAEGILVTGFGFGPASSGNVPYARAHADGTFTMNVAAAHGYIIGVSDLEWASDLWSGVILASDADHPREINIKTYPATPLTFCVTRGANRERVANAWIHIARNSEVAHVDQSGEVETGISGVREWLRTSADGVARAGVGRGAVEVRLSNGEWQDTRTIEISSAEPQEIEFHRHWEGRRRITARLKLNGSDFAASAKMVIRAWTPHDDRGFTVHQPEVHDDGTIEVAFDEETIALLVVDPGQQLSAFSQLGLDDSSVEVEMQPAATCSGAVVDENGLPMANRGLRLVVTRSLIDVLEPQKTDDMGRFRFSAVPVNAPLRLSIVNDEGLPEYTLFDGERLFEPGEQRVDEVLRPIRTDSQ